jgi:hypothetical protein
VYGGRKETDALEVRRTMTGKLRRRSITMGVALVLAGAATALAGQTDRGGFHLGVGSAQPASATGLKFRVLYKNPDDPEGKPPPVTAATFRLPRGMRIDTGAVPRCEATDGEIQALGRDACPAESEVGSGRLTARTGIPGSDEVHTDIVAFNGDEEIVEVVFFEGTNAVAGIDRLTMDGNVLSAHPPATPGGPPDGKTAVQRIFLELPLRVGAGGEAYVTTPSRCRNGRWKASADYEFADGGKTTVPSRTRCSPA